MSPRTFLSCRRLNSPLAAYCYFDGTPLATGTRGPYAVGSQEFPSPFVFPSGRCCRSFEELAHACRQEWAEAQRLLAARIFQPFLAALGRADLVQTADRAVEHPDPDLGLDEFLAGMPGREPAPAGLEVGGDEIDLGTGAVGQDRKVALTIRNSGERLLSGLVRIENGAWLGVETPGLNEKRFKATAHEQLELLLHVRGKQLRAGIQPLAPCMPGTDAARPTLGRGQRPAALQGPGLPSRRGPRRHRGQAVVEVRAGLGAPHTARAAAVPRLCAAALPGTLLIQPEVGTQTGQVPVAALPPLPKAAPPPLPAWVPAAPSQETLLPTAAPMDSARGGRRWGPVLACLLLVGLLIAGGVVAWRADRDSAPNPCAAAVRMPTTRKTETFPPRKKAPAGEPVSPLLGDVVRRLTSPDRETNRKAIEELPTLDDAEVRQATPALVGAAGRHDDEVFRQRAAQELKRLGPPRKDVDCLKEAIQVSHPALWRYAVSALKEMGEQARAAGGVLAEALKDHDPELRREAMGVLHTLGPTARVLVLRPLLNPAGDADEEAVLGALGELLPRAR